MTELLLVVLIFGAMWLSTLYPKPPRISITPRYTDITPYVVDITINLERLQYTFRNAEITFTDFNNAFQQIDFVLKEGEMELFDRVWKASDDPR